MNDTFVPLVIPAAKTHENRFSPLQPKSVTAKLNGDAPKPADTPAAPVPAPCAKPTVTLQRNGDIVTSIRVQCGCGQVIDIACVY